MDGFLEERGASTACRLAPPVLHPGSRRVVEVMARAARPRATADLAPTEAVLAEHGNAQAR
ncbi:MAG: hypothetical protein U0599_03955 [Vicinamibacteria bacterium]